MKILCSLVLLVVCCSQGLTKSFGVIGEIFPVVEKSFLVLIEERLHALTLSGGFDALNQKWLHTVVNHTNRPSPLSLERIHQTISHYYTSEITLSQDITDYKGKVLYPKGTYINALEYMPAYNPCWLFFNADDEAQIRWAQIQKNNCSSPKFILTGGAIKVAEKSLNAVIYFDQEGRITSRLNIIHVPARVTRKANQLFIVEEAIKENGNAL